jgi:PadR family transcriptional regulator, regulatory protein PadR
MSRSEIREPSFHVLAALAGGPKHGYALMREIEESSAGRVKLRPGTLYGALDRLSSEGLVRESHEEVVDGRLRRYYDLTDEGARVLGDEARRLRRNVELAVGALKLRGVTA